MKNYTEYSRQELEAIAITYAMDAMKKEWKAALEENDTNAAEHYYEMWLAYKTINEEQEEA